MATKKTTAEKAPKKTASTKPVSPKASLAASRGGKKSTELVPAADETKALATTPRKSKALTVSPKKANASKKAAAAKAETATMVDQYRTHKEDTGSTTVQIAQLTQQIADLQKHLKKHAKDHDSLRGLHIMVGKRRRLLNYLVRTNPKQYTDIIAELKLRK